MKQTQNMIVCRCEEVTVGNLLNTAEKYQCSARELKMRTRAAMGYCGGRTCRYLVDHIIQNTIDDPSSNQSSLSYRPPIRPIPFANLGVKQNED